MAHLGLHAFSLQQIFPFHLFMQCISHEVGLCLLILKLFYGLMSWLHLMLSQLNKNTILHDEYIQTVDIIRSSGTRSSFGLAVQICLGWCATGSVNLNRGVCTVCIQEFLLKYNRNKNNKCLDDIV